ncbi:MAG TPA: hypothetical protein VK835_10015 [Bacteroidia bacterium]|jgi:hypothetical protein|nr:hypothetical protein [Bacteroidia bacterium]
MSEQTKQGIGTQLLHALVLFAEAELPVVEQAIELTACKKLEIFKAMLHNAQNNLPANHPLKKLVENAGINLLLSIAQIAETELSCPMPQQTA